MQETHGGNIYALSEKLCLNEKDIIDFSASINPLGIPESVHSAIKDNIKYLHNYPDPDAKRLRSQIAKYHKINPESIICGNGSTELIYLIVRSLSHERVLLPAPTFSEYERAVTINAKCKMQNAKIKIHNIVYFPLNIKDNFNLNPDELIKAMEGRLHFDMVFICNPNNPTGRLLKKDEVLMIAEAARKLKCYLVVDEAFIDFVPEESVIKEVAKNSYLIVLRSLTKFYALSGLRIGYGVFPLNIIENIKENKEPWTVNTLAQTAGIAAFNDRQYRGKTYKVIGQEKQFMEDWFEKLGIDYIPSSANYYLIRLNNAEEVITFLRNKGILVRKCSNFSGLDESYIRVAVKSRRDNARLFKELSLCLKA
ncbi:MAG: histidinol-phosphate transaminase [Thermodesulfovibrionales bacterium]